MGFKETIQKLYPGAIASKTYFQGSTSFLNGLGFDAPNTIACVGVCRDEITRPFVDQVHAIWGEAFNFSSLGAMLFLGKTGFTAAIHHAPDASAISRYVFFAMAHIGVDAEGAIGFCSRPKQQRLSRACGALVTFHKELSERKVRLELDPDDLEQSLLKQRLLSRIPYGEVPDIVGLTQIAQDTIFADLERYISLTVEPTKCAYGVMTGILIHGPDHQDWIWPSTSYALVENVKHSFDPAPKA
ncbi:MAG: hypothetical protein RBU30_16820 [Polyangia bacterium]|jgi:hypothetical protein|nr:hypothetical protein [Polyangia bacterium]